MLMKTKEQTPSLHEDATYILDGLTMEGSLDGGEFPIVIDGKFKGDITANELIISEQGIVTGKVKATTATIKGKFNGELVCESLTVTATGAVEGEVQADALSIDLGAEVIGSISRIKRKS
jgi:cytoskeletal protein CcmA (bactofilin family)